MQYYFDASGLHFTQGGVTLVVTVLAIVAMLIVADVVKTSIRARQGIRPSVTQPAGSIGLTATRKTELLIQDNARLQGQVARPEERLSIVERTAVDPARHIAAEIDGLR